MAPTSGVGLALYQMAYVVSGSANVLIYEWQDGIVIDAATGRTFAHPLGQVLLAYIAMMLLGAGRRVALWRRRRRRAARAALADPSAEALVVEDEPVASDGMPAASFRWYHAVLPGVLHLGSLLLTTIAVQYTTAAIVQILRGAVVIFTAGLTRILLKRTLQPFQYAGVLVVVLGVVVVSLATTRGAQGDFGSNPLLGDSLVLIAQLVLALRGVTEEHVMRKYSVHELEMAGLEGIIATTTCVLIYLVGLAFPAIALDDLIQFFTDMGVVATALISSLLLFALQGVLQATAIGVVKATSAVAKTILSQMRVVVVWVPSVLFMGGVVNALELVGFAVLTFGVFVYMNLVPYMPSVCYANTTPVVEVGEPSAGPDIGMEMPGSMRHSFAGIPIEGGYGTIDDGVASGSRSAPASASPQQPAS